MRSSRRVSGAKYNWVSCRGAHRLDKVPAWRKRWLRRRVRRESV